MAIAVCSFDSGAFSGSRLTVSPPDGDDQVFDLNTEEQAAADLLKELRNRVREAAFV